MGRVGGGVVGRGMISLVDRGGAEWVMGRARTGIRAGVYVVRSIKFVILPVKWGTNTY